MALLGNGQLLIKTGAASAVPMAAIAPMAARGSILPGYTLEPLSHHALAVSGAARLMAVAGAVIPAEQWLLAKPTTSGHDTAPWDTAHAAAAALDYSHLVEPDILHKRARPPVGELKDGLNRHWPPEPAVDGKTFSPCWHLEKGWGNFIEARARATGAGIRVAHLDTGYSATHVSRPRHLRPDLGWDYWDNKANPIDPGAPGLLLYPGHGPATLALLAGNTMDLRFLDGRYVGDIGGAPDAEVVPVRISPSVVHLATSTMAEGLYHAMAPGTDPKHPDPANRCDVVSLSHGGLPSHIWADAVNALYEAGILIVAASGDNIYLDVADMATRYTVYPSAFNRVVTAVGTTYDKKPYITKTFDVMQGCWGPNAVMEKAIAGFTPNVPWMRFNTVDGFDMDGGGTSCAAPQIAAACVLWLELYRGGLPMDWRRIEACRLALWKSASANAQDQGELGWGLLNAAGLLDETLANSAINEVLSRGDKAKSAPDSVSVPVLRLLLGWPPPGSERERMYEAEVAQLISGTRNPDLAKVAREPHSPGAVNRAHFRDMLADDGASNALKQRMAHG